MPTGRRGFLYATTAAMGVAGLAAAAWPLIDQLNPDSGVRAASDLIDLDLDLAGLAPGERRVARWRRFPIFVTKRTAAMLQAMQEPQLIGRLRDASSSKRQQPPYATNCHRSINPALAFWSGSAPIAAPCPNTSRMPYRPICRAATRVRAARHTSIPAGRAHAGPAQYNLPVPPYEMMGPSRVAVGRNRSGDLFVFESIERI